jgi:hypothetical protein
MKAWPDNFLNTLEFGKVDPYGARNRMPYWDALVGYIGDSPPPRGSYAKPYNPDVAAAAQQVFPVFPQLGTLSVFVAQEDGYLFLAFNADAYSDYVADNEGSVTVSVTPDTGYLQRLGTPDLASVCQVLPGLLLNAVCWAADQLTGGTAR